MTAEVSTNVPVNREQRRAAEKRGRRLAALGSGAVLAVSAGGLATALAAGPAVASATTFEVTNTNDSGAGSLRDAIDQANANPGQDTITFAADVTGTITLLSDLSPITDAVDIEGPGASVLTVNGNGHALVVFDTIDSSAGADTISGLTLTGGNADDNNDGSGGGIQKYEGNADLTISDMVVTGNTSPGNDAGGVQFYETSGTVNVTNTQITNNTADEGGGALYSDESGGALNVTISNSVLSGNSSYYGGGIVALGGTWTIINSTISNNTTSGGTGGGIFANDANFTIESSTVSGNTTSSGKGGGGGGIYVDNDSEHSFTMLSSTVSGNVAHYYGGGLYIVDSGGAATIDNSTISGNTASQAGGIYGGYGGLTINQSTITLNTATNPSTAPAVGGIQLTGVNSEIPAAKAQRIQARSQRGTAGEAKKREAKGQGIVRAKALGTADLSGTIVAGNGGDDIGSANHKDTVTFNSDHSILGTVDTDNVTVNDLGGTQTGVTDPGLAPLANNGGPTETQALLSGSPAIDAGPVPVATFPGNDFDQRGEGFDRVVNGKVDVGAYEVQPPPTPEPVIIQPKFTG
jgi:parallel beta-helix repeat protein/predicted outer membrane repeat protein